MVKTNASPACEDNREVGQVHIASDSARSETAERFDYCSIRAINLDTGNRGAVGLLSIQRKNFPTTLFSNVVEVLSNGRISLKPLILLNNKTM